MPQRFVRDESGVALGLAVILIVLIGVMGAGLLVFVRNDLEAVVETNQGRKALEVAEAGAQAARQHLLRDKRATHYDIDDSSGCDAGDDALEPARVGDDWSPAAGVSRSFVGEQFDVTIQWLNTNPPLGTPPECVAPVTGADAAGFDYFKIISTGSYGGAKRKVEVIYNTYTLHVPEAYYTPGEIEIKGSACINSVSLFTSSNIKIAGTGTGCGDGSKIKGADLNYGDWNDPPSDDFNTTARTGPTCTTTLSDGTTATKTCAGVAAVGTITGTVRSGLDYDSTTSPKFVAAPTTDPQGSSEITFPFNINAQPNAEALCDSVRELGPPYYIKDDSTTNATVSLSTWPMPSNSDTVVCYEFTDKTTNHTLKWDVNGEYTYPSGHIYEGCEGDPRQGTLVVKGGNFTTQSNKAILKGIVVVRGPAGSDGSSTDTGKTCLDGFVNATGKITLAGSVRPSTSFEGEDRPGFYGIKTWSWRELYQ